MQGKKLSGGLLCILAAIALLLIGVLAHFSLPYGITPHQLITGVLCILLAFYVLTRKSIHLIYLPIAALYLLFEEQIADALGTDTPLISHFLVYVITVLLCVGTYNLIYGKNAKSRMSRWFGKFAFNMSDMGNIASSRVRYADAATLDGTFFENNAGRMEIFIQNSESYGGNKTIQLLNNAGNMVLHVPSDWHIIEKNLNSSMGHIEIRPNPKSDEKILYIQGQNNAGYIQVVSP